MKQTEIGMIPDDWEVKELGSTNHIETGTTPPTEDLSNYGIEYFFVSPFDLGNSKYIENTEKRLSSKGYSIARHFPKNSILFTCIGSTIGKIGISKQELTSNQQINAIFPNKNIDNEYQFYALLTRIDDIRGRAGQQAVPLINKTEFGHTLYPLPPTLAEQQKIAKALSDVDNVISTLEKLITKKKNLKQGTMQQLLTGKKRLPGFAKSDKFKQTEIGEIPEDWEVVNIQDILITTKDKLKIGPFGSQLKKEYLLENGQYKVFGQENVYLNDFEYCYRFLTKEHFQNLQSCELKEGDFVISTMGTIGKCAIVPKKAGVGIMDSHLVRLRLNQNIDKEYFKYYFQSDIIQNQIAALSVGGIMDGLSTSIIKKLKVIKFSISEQTAIANVLSSMDKEIEALETKLGKYRNLKTGMMQQLLTGKIRLR